MNINNSISGISKPKTQTKSFDSGSTAKMANTDNFKTMLAGTQTQSKTETAPRTDKIEFSHSNVQTVSTLQLANLKSKIATDLKTETKYEKIERITKQIEQKEYKVDPYELAEIMFRI